MTPTTAFLLGAGSILGIAILAGACFVLGWRAAKAHSSQQGERKS